MAEDFEIELFVFRTGTEAETIVFGEAARERRRATIAAGVEVACLACGSDLVYPLEWEKTDADMWLVTLRCPECHRVYDTALERPAVERFVGQLHSQKRALAHDLAKWSLARFLEETERFVEALRGNHVLPMDF